MYLRQTRCPGDSLVDCVVWLNLILTSQMLSNKNKQFNKDFRQAVSAVRQSHRETYSVWTVSTRIKGNEAPYPESDPAAMADSSAVSVWVISMHRAEEWVLTSLSVVVLLYEAWTETAWMLTVPWPLNGWVDGISTETCHCSHVEESRFRLKNMQRLAVHLFLLKWDDFTLCYNFISFFQN